MDQLDSTSVGTRGTGILAAHASWKDLPFADVAEAFHMIPDAAVPLIIPGAPFGADDALMDLIQEARAVDGLAKRLQPYVVNISRQLRRQMITEGSADVIRADRFGEQFVMPINTSAYDGTMGLRPENTQDLGLLAF